MKYILVYFALFCSLLALFLWSGFPEDAHGECALLTKPLVYGTISKEVVVLQQFLIQEGHDIPAGATGYYGPQTRAAVNEFQVKYMFQILFPVGLTKPTGNVYRMTLAQINALHCL